MSKILIFLVIGYVSALTDEQLKIELTKVILMCNKDFPVVMDELLSLQKYIVPTNRQTKCLLACTYRRIGTLNKKGLFDTEASYKLAERDLEDDVRIKAGKALADECVKANEIEVSDGEKGCDRAVLIFKCVITHAPKLGFKI